MKQFIFTAGLPGSGKSYWLKEHFDLDSLAFVSADEIKEEIAVEMCHGSLCDIDEFLSSIHEESIEKARDRAKQFMANQEDTILMDMGGINNHYTQHLIEYAHDFGYKCRAILFDTPIEVCIERMKERGRVIPMDNMYKKNCIMNRCFENIMDSVEEYEVVHYFTNKYIFLDMDGTICAYQKPPRDIDGNVDFVNSGMFKNPAPVKHIIDWVRKNYPMENVYILGVSPNSICQEDKIAWLSRYFSGIDYNHVYFCGNKDYKHIMLKHLMYKLKMDKKDVLMIDDNYQVINNMLGIGVNCIHPSNLESIQTTI